MGSKESEVDNQMNQTSRQKTKTRWINEPRTKQRMNNRTMMMERHSMTKKDDDERASSETELFTNVLTQSIQGTSRTLGVGERMTFSTDGQTVFIEEKQQTSICDGVRVTTGWNNL